MPFIALADIAVWIGFGGILAGTLTTWCRDHPGDGCVGKRSLVQDVLAIRADVGPCNVPKYNFDICNNQLQDQKKKGIKVLANVPSKGVAQFDNIPPACMNLAVVLSGSCTGTGPRPTPCGSACMKYTGMSDKQLRQLSSYLQK
ncbi:hypothetical protein V8F33_014180 [Rhypophila sp. PSN 637]